MPQASQWNIDENRSAIRRIVEFGESGESGPICLEHPDYPYWDVLTGIDAAAFSRRQTPLIDAINGSSLLQSVSGYLTKVWPDVGVPLPPDFNLFTSTGKFSIFPNGLQISWLPVGGDPNNSCVVFRSESIESASGQPKSQLLLDVSLAIFAVQVWDRDDPTTAFRSGVGLRVDVDLRWDQEHGVSLQIDGVSLSAGFLQAALRPVGNPSPFKTLERYLSTNSLRFSDLGDRLKSVLAASIGLPPDRIVVEGLNTELTDDDPRLVQVRAYASPLLPASEPAVAIVAMLDLSGEQPLVQRVSTSPLVVHAVEADLFAHDPGTATQARQLADPASTAGLENIVSARANRSAQALEQFRYPIALCHLDPGEVPLADPDGWYEVRKSKLVDRRADEKDVQPVDGSNASMHARTNDFSAVSAYRQLCDLFDKIDGFGLDRASVFRFLPVPDPATRVCPIIVRYRARMLLGPGRDGKIVNAQVDFDPPSLALGQPWTNAANTLKPVQIRFGLADVQRSSSGREPLGLAADPRWSWHEFGHLLLAGSTQKLEFVFAHSAGDALAAIVSDPLSKFAVPNARQPAMRGATFPWVRISRRHDRAVELGWSWTGTYHRPYRFDLLNSNLRHKGYDSEQILSTTLFRVYRALGGDTLKNGGSEADVDARQDASDYTTYLIMRAIATIGSAYSVPIQTVRQFAGALQRADKTTQRSTTGLLVNRVGGCAHKVVRWAFEQQGLYAGVAATEVHDAVGRPPDVDVYIDDLRNFGDASRKPGEYTPVSLDWDLQRTPAWHANPQAMSIVNTNAVPGLTVTVGNRGTQTAQNVRVSAFYIDWPIGASAPPRWNKWIWKWLSPSSIASAPLPAGALVTFGPFNGLPSASGRYLVLAEARAVDDRPNTYVALTGWPIHWVGLPCAFGETWLADLVAGDNNLGLLVYTVP